MISLEEFKSRRRCAYQFQRALLWLILIAATGLASLAPAQVIVLPPPVLIPIPPTSTVQPVIPVSLLVLYTPQAAAAAGGTNALLKQISIAVVEANTVFQNSRVSTRLYLAHATLVNYHESGTVSNDLARLRNPNDKVFQNAHLLRLAYGADLVCLITENGSDYQFYGLQGPSAANAFSILRQPFLTGLDYLPVVLSFNFGCQLERPYADSAAAFPYAYGDTFYGTNGLGYQAAYSTVDAFGAARLPVFSNPDIQFGGAPAGIPVGDPNPCDNALVLNQTTPIVASFYGTAHLTLPPVITITSPTPDDLIYSGTNLPLTATVSAPGGKITSVTWYFDDTNEIATVTTAPYRTVWRNVPIGAHVLTAVATDNQHATTAAYPMNVSIRPGNDNFANRWTIGKLPFSLQEDNTLATTEPGEPMIAGFPPLNSLWWTWTATADTGVTITLATNSIIFNLSVWTGTSLSNLTAVASGIYTPSAPASLFFRATAGTRYQIAADGWDGFWQDPNVPTGTIAFTVASGAGPANDDFAQRTRLSGSSITVNANNLYATQEPGEPGLPDIGPYAGDASVWYTWTAPANGQVTFTSTSANLSESGPLGFGFYTGNVLTNLTPVPCENADFTVLDTPDQSLVFDVQAGVTYQLACDTNSRREGYTGPFTFNINFVPFPPNDNFANRTILHGSALSLTNSSLLATLESGEPGDGSGNPSIWWSWTPLTSGWVTLTSATYDNLLVYTGNSLDSLVPVPLDSSGTFYATGGTAYAIAAYGPPGPVALSLLESTVQVTSPANNATYYLGTPIPLTASTTGNDGITRQIQYFANGQLVGTATKPPYKVTWLPPTAGQYGNYVLTATATDYAGNQRHSPPVNIGVVYRAPANDNFAHRDTLQGTWLTATASNQGATSEPGEPVIADGYTNSLWWQWTAPASGLVTLSAASDNWNDDYLAVYTGSNLPAINLASLASLNSGYHVVTFTAAAGTTYYFGVVGPSGSVGLKLSLSNLQITRPAYGAVFTNGSTLTLQALPTATEQPLQQIQFFANGNYLGSVTNAPYTFTWTNVPGLNYALLATAIDKLGHDRSSPVVNISLQPANDRFANRTILQGDWISVTNSTANATAEPGNPPLEFNSVGPCVWWQWTAPASGLVNLSVPSYYRYDAVYLGVFTGDTITNLQTVAKGFDPLTFSAMAGTNYVIAAPAAVSVLLNLQLILSNVQITSPTNGQTVTIGTNLLFSVDASSVQNPVREVDFYTNNTLLGAVTNAPYSLSWTNVGGGSFTLTATAVDNQGRTWPTPPVTMNAVPVNDDFSHATPLTGTDFSVTGSTIGAGWEPGEPGLFYYGQDQTIWYTWTAPAAGVYYLNLTSFWLGQLTVYTGTSLTNLTPVGSVADISDYPLAINATAGATYQIQLDSAYDVEFNFDLQAAPVNATFASAIPLTGTNITITGNDNYGYPDGSVWYSWTAPTNGEATVTNSASGWLPNVQIFTGNDPANLIPVASGTPASFTPVAGVTYWIMVNNGPGPFSLNFNFTPAPGNDFFANRTPLSGLNITVNGTLLYSTVEPGETNYADIFGLYPYYGGGSVWYSWTAPASGYVRIQPPQANLAVFTGDDISNLTSVIFGQYDNEIDFNALAGQTYQIAVVQSSLWNPGPFTWSLAMNKVTITNPVAGAIFPLGTNIEVAASTIDLDGAVTSVAFYANTNLLGIVTNSPFSLVMTNVTAGDYVLTAQATDANTNVTTSLPVEIQVPPPNDNFAQRIPLGGTNLTFSGDNGGATTEPGESLPSGASGRTLWWSWTAPTNGVVTLTTAILSGFENATNSGFPIVYNHAPADVIIINPFPPEPSGSTTGPLVSFYTGNSLPNLDLWASNGTNGYFWGYYFGERGVLSPFTFPVVGGQTYQISMDGVNGSFGAASINLALNPPLSPPPNDNFAQRTVLTGSNIATNGTTVGATLELTDPDIGSGLDARTVWYSWTAPASGTVTLAVAAPFYDGFPSPGPQYPPYGVYAGSTPGSLIPLATGNNFGNASFYALAGTAYQIEVATASESEGPFTLSLTALAPLALSPAPPIRLANGSYDLHVIGSLGQSFVIQSSLNGKTWTTIDTDTLLASSLDFLDTSAIGHPARAYRVLSLDTVLNQQPFAMRVPHTNPANGFPLNLTGTSGQPFLIQTSTNLLDWYNLTSGVLIDNAFNFTDYDAPNYPQRFYRTIPQ